MVTDMIMLTLIDFAVDAGLFYLIWDLTRRVSALEDIVTKIAALNSNIVKHLSDNAKRQQKD
jgi:hypothetical protein